VFVRKCFSKYARNNSFVQHHFLDSAGFIEHKHRDGSHEQASLARAST
jgi:hypothetical protein